MAARALLVAELASNHGGDWSVLRELIEAAANAGADYVKLQLYDASMLREDDPQKAWLNQAQVSRAMLGHARDIAAGCRVQLTASVFGIPQAQMAREVGLTTIKIGSGEVSNLALYNAVWDLRFDEVWVSEGISRAPWTEMTTPRVGRRYVFYGVSQYPTPYIRGLAVLTNRLKSMPFGWSDHGDSLEVAKEAILHGATYVERHFNIHDGPRDFAEWDTDADGFAELRAFAEQAAWEGTPEHEAACKTYLNRWGN